MLNERRNFPRIDTSLSAEVINRQGESLGATITDLSMGGLTLEGEASLQQHIEVIDSETGEPVFPLEASVVFHFLLDDVSHHLKGRYRLVHKHRVSQNILRLGMRMLAIDEGERQQLARYIEDFGKA